MSKKLMMNNYSENGLMPVRNGLICWLDGRDGSGTDTVWKDRGKNGNDFELNGFTFDGENGWTGSNLKVNFGQYVTRKITLDEEYTIDIDLYTDGYNGNEQTRFFYLGNNNPSNRRDYTFRRASIGSSYVHIKHGNDYVIISDKLKRYNIVVCGTLSGYKIYLDGVLFVEKNSNIMSKTEGFFVIGAGEDFKNFCKARLNSVKIYNRALTEEEVARNYAYEQSIERS